MTVKGRNIWTDMKSIDYLWFAYRELTNWTGMNYESSSEQHLANESICLSLGSCINIDWSRIHWKECIIQTYLSNFTLGQSEFNSFLCTWSTNHQFSGCRITWASDSPNEQGIGMLPYLKLRNKLKIWIGIRCDQVTNRGHSRSSL